MTPTEPASALWQNGWYRHARRLRSPNFGERPPGAPVDLILIHSISLPPGQYGGGQVQQLFTNQLDWDAHPYFDAMRGLQVSAHFFIGRNGELWQFVSCHARAWHAGASSFQGRSNCNDTSVGIELEGLEGDCFEQAQYESLTALCSAIVAVHPVTHVVGHEHVAPGRKKDPGAGFEWWRLQRALGWPDQCFPESVIALKQDVHLPQPP